VYPARIFLGDTGAAVVGFSLAALSLTRAGTPGSEGAVLLPLFIFGLPLAEFLLTIVRRVIRRVRTSTGGLFTADRDHVHHRLVARGMRDRTAVLVLYGAGTLAAATGVASLAMSSVQTLLAASGLLVAGGFAVRRLGYEEFTVTWRRGVRAAGHAAGQSSAGNAPIPAQAPTSTLVAQ
jgi:UDP-GlcNAc:undecaprenyl-phosphate GlcNAc-1-phosphate transferase